MKLTDTEYILIELFKMDVIQAIGTDYTERELEVELSEFDEEIIKRYRNGSLTFVPPGDLINLELLSTEN